MREPGRFLVLSPSDWTRKAALLVRVGRLRSRLAIRVGECSALALVGLQTASVGVLGVARRIRRGVVDGVFVHGQVPLEVRDCPIGYVGLQSSLGFPGLSLVHPHILRRAFLTVLAGLIGLTVSGARFVLLHGHLSHAWPPSFADPITAWRAGEYLAEQPLLDTIPCVGRRLVVSGRWSSAIFARGPRIQPSNPDCSSSFFLLIRPMVYSLTYPGCVVIFWYLG